ncbi:MAG: cyclic nucleotide-binding domain-containing protein [Azospirillum sp.]|nr:cyclic nucleotide-binding domain-containing protein [Azospirillum sp.]
MDIPGLGVFLDWQHAAGFIAAGLVFSSFCMKTMIPLRSAALASNVAFLAYSVPLGLWPIAILHGALLPLNLARLLELRRLVRRLRDARVGDFDITALLPLMKRESFPAGHAIFRRGDPAEKAYYLHSGRIDLPEFGAVLYAGAFFGEVGLFTPDNARTATAVCATPVELYSIDAKGIVSAFSQEPGFAVHLIGLVGTRLNEDMNRLKTRAVAPTPATAD